MAAETHRNARLQEPGAGLPGLELLVARGAFGIQKTFTSREKALRLFLSEAQRMTTIADSLAVADAAEPRLITRVFGIEDSSRNWSVLMTLQHLVIVDSGIIGILKRLTAGLTVPGTVSTAAVKPERVDDPEVVEKFRVVVKDYEELLGKLPSLKTQRTHAHPWFGKLDAHAWHCLAASHHSIHRRQIERIAQAFRVGT
jgi:hypothetical protein